MSNVLHVSSLDVQPTAVTSVDVLNALLGSSKIKHMYIQRFI